jgi:phenylacetate-CoA ligase
VSDPRFWDPEAQGASFEQRREKLTGRLVDELAYVYESSEFFRTRLDAAGYSPGSVGSFEDFRDLPILFRKEDERTSIEESLATLGHPYGTHLCAEPADTIVRQATSGTSGNPTWYLFTEADYEGFAEAGARYWHWCGVRPGDTVLFAMGSGMWVSALFVSALRKMGACPLPVGLEAGAESLLRYADLCRPTALLATPSLCRMLIEEAPRLLDKEVGALGIRSLILGGEVGAGLPAVRRQLEEAYGARVYDIIGPFWGNAYASCEADTYHGLHCLTDDLAVWHQDIRDPLSGEPVPITDGAIGEACTSAGRHQAAPMMKYGSGDVLQVFTEPCECGFTGERILIRGRVQDMLSVAGTHCFPADVINAVAGVGDAVTGALRIRLKAPPPTVEPPLNLMVEVAGTVDPAGSDPLRRSIESSVGESLGVPVSVELVEADSLDRSATKTDVILHDYAV